MRGPHDDRIERLRATARTGAEGTLPAPRPSKALIRLTQLLERSGHEDHATRVLIHALPENRRGEFEARSRQFTASPARIPGTPERPLPRGTDRTLIAESLALAHAAAAELWTSAPP